MKRILLLILALTLTACAPQVTVTSEVTVTLTPTEPTSVPPAPINSEQSTLVSQPEVIAQLVENYLKAPFPLNSLTSEQLSAFTHSFDSSRATFEQRQTFSIALNEHKNEQRGANPVIYTDESGAKFYIDPRTGDFLPVDNGTTAEQQTIELYLPRVVDSEGYTHVFYDGAWIKIEGSQNIQFDDFENFNWPDTEIADPQFINEKNQHLTGLTIPEYLFKEEDGRQRSMLPVIILGKEIGEINIVGYRNRGTLFGYVPSENDPYSVDKVIIVGGPTLYADGVAARSSGGIGELSPFWQELKENHLYYSIYLTDQKAAFATTYPGSNGQEVTAAYKGIVPSNQTTSIITGEIDSQDLALILTNVLVKKSGE